MDFCREQYQITFTDQWGDVLAYRNCGFNAWISDDVPSMFDQEKVQGLLAGLRVLKQKNSKLRLGMSIGGWTMP
ncbi:MAG: hypothetical protein K2Q15_12220, partial [Burkholderiales bacterium]|nr:hypothetical protein [Burkholderiales bacterium]